MKCFETGSIYQLAHRVYDNGAYYYKVLRRSKKSIRLVEVGTDGTEIPGEDAFTAKIFVAEGSGEYVMIPDVDICCEKRELRAADKI